MNLKQSLHTMGEVLKKPKYLLLTIVVAFLFYLVNVLIFDIATLHSISMNQGFTSAVKALFLLALEFTSVIQLHSFFSVLILSILVGVFVSLIIYKVRLNMSLQDSGKTGVLAGVGLFLAIFVPGCAACGVGILALLGLSGTFAGLFGGHLSIWLSIISILVLLFAILKLAHDMYICKNPKINKLKGGSNK